MKTNSFIIPIAFFGLLALVIVFIYALDVYIGLDLDRSNSRFTTQQNQSDVEAEPIDDAQIQHQTSSIIQRNIDIGLGVLEDSSAEDQLQVGDNNDSSKTPKDPVPQSAGYYYNSFNGNYTIEESGTIFTSDDPDWSLSSGAYFYASDGVGSTIQGPLQSTDHWFDIYKESNSRDTDGGYFPQNIFRLVLLKQFTNFEQQSYFYITENNNSESWYRNGSNGLLFFNRYHDADNLYYVGIRVDGGVTIKKKVGGTYYDIAYNKIFEGEYDRGSNPSLLPTNKWIGLKSEVTNIDDNQVLIRVFVDLDRSGNWILVSEGVDDGISFGGEVLKGGFAGIRTDFMDVQFDDYMIQEIR
ncbi:MAG: hypothetical protein ACPGO5_03205 [Patescibacteria group bacterium]